MSDIEEVQKEEVWMGNEAQNFLNTALGRYMIERTQAERNDAMLELRLVDSTDAEKIRELQNIIKRAESFPNWINELIHTGDKAYEDLVAENNTTGE